MLRGSQETVMKLKLYRNSFLNTEKLNWYLRNTLDPSEWEKGRSNEYLFLVTKGVISTIFLNFLSSFIPQPPPTMATSERRGHSLFLSCGPGWDAQGAHWKKGKSPHSICGPFENKRSWRRQMEILERANRNWRSQIFRIFTPFSTFGSDLYYKIHATSHLQETLQLECGLSLWMDPKFSLTPLSSSDKQFDLLFSPSSKIFWKAVRWSEAGQVGSTSGSREQN